MARQHQLCSEPVLPHSMNRSSPGCFTSGCLADFEIDGLLHQTSARLSGPAIVLWGLDSSLTHTIKCLKPWPQRLCCDLYMGRQITRTNDYAQARVSVYVMLERYPGSAIYLNATGMVERCHLFVLLSTVGESQKPMPCGGHWSHGSVLPTLLTYASGYGSCAGMCVCVC